MFHRNNGCIETFLNYIYFITKIVPPKQWLYWNILISRKLSPLFIVPPKQWLYWNWNLRYKSNLQNSSTETMVVLKLVKPAFIILFKVFHRNNGCIETFFLSYKSNHCHFSSTETMVVLKLFYCFYNTIPSTVPPKQWLYWNWDKLSIISSFGMFHRNNGCIETLETRLNR